MRGSWGDPAITSIIRLPSGVLRLQGTGTPHAPCTLHTSSTLLEHSFIPSTLVTPNASGDWQHGIPTPSPASRGFYRLTQP